MSEARRIKTALVSVYHKEGLDEIITKLHEEGVQFLSTGGTRQFIESLGYPCQAVEDLTTYPSILGGRVKTLHPKVFGGILCRRELEQDIQQITQYEIPEIDLVIVDLYPFEATVASGAEEQAIIEKIDIERYLDGVELVVVGGESDTNARPLDYAWVLDIREQCIRKNVSFEFRQCGTHFIKDGREYKLQTKDLCAQARKAGIDLRLNG